jgi:NaMN:DMB phosphoribosyltransferase
VRQLPSGASINSIEKEKGKMDPATVVRVVAGALAVVVLGIIIWRRKRKASV